MDAKIVNRVLSVIFFVLAVFFFVLYNRELNIKSRLSDDFVKEAVLNLENSGVDISPEIINPDIPSKSIYVFEIDSIDNHNDAVAQLLCEKLYGNGVTTAKFEMPDGVSVGIYGGEDKNEIARIVFNNGDSSFRLVKDGINISGTDMPFLNGKTDMISENKQSVILEICKTLSDKSKLNYRLSGCSGDENFSVATAVMTVDGHDCSDVFMNFVFENGELVAVFGRWIIEPVKSKYNNTLIDGINALYELDLDQVSAVTGQKISYKLKSTDSSKYYFIPVWEISYTDKNGVYKTAYIESI